MNYIDVKYLNQISPRLELFKRTGDNVWNFRCPYCGDSRLNKLKARGYVYKKQNEYFFCCKNGCSGTTLNNFIKYIDPQVHKEYVFEKFRGSPKEDTQKDQDLKFKTNTKFERPQWLKTPLLAIPKLSSLEPTHKVRVYTTSRKIPSKRLQKLFYAEKFYDFCNKMVPDKFPNITKDEPRIIIPMIDKNNVLIGFQGRALHKTNNKYITIMLEEEIKVFGLDTVDFSKPVYVVEGPINSMFVPNCIAMVGADHKSIVERFQGPEFIFIYDNEPRSEQIVTKIEDCINSGYKVSFFPDNIDTSLDINDIIKDGLMTAEELYKSFKRNTVSGLMAKLKLSMWRKDHNGNQMANRYDQNRINRPRKGVSNFE